MGKEQINLVYVDDDPEEALSAYLEDGYSNDQCDLKLSQVKFECEKGYESLLTLDEVTAANVILIDSRLFENDKVQYDGKFSGEEFRMILRKMFPFIEVLVISQNGEDRDYDIVPKHRSESSETAMNYYNRVLKSKIDESIRKVLIFRNISKKLGTNNGIEKLLVEKVVNSLNGINDYENLTKCDIDNLIAVFQEIS